MAENDRAGILGRGRVQRHRPPVLLICFCYVCALAALLCGSRVQAQSPRSWAFEGAMTAQIFIGEAELVDGGIGVDGTVWRKLAPHASLRFDAMVMPLDDQTTPLESADNRMLVLALGPELATRVGPLSFYGRALAGLAVNQQSRAGSARPERTTSALAYGGGAGVRLALTSRLSLDVGGDILQSGEVAFARTAVSGGEYLTDPVMLRLRAGLALGAG